MSTDEPIDPLQLLDCDDLATLLKMSRKWVEDQVAGELIPYTRVGARAVRFTREQAAEIIARGKRDADTPPARRIANVSQVIATPRRRRRAA